MLFDSAYQAHSAPSSRVQHGLVTQLIEQAPADVRNHGAQYTKCRTGRRAATNGTVLPANECPTSTTSSLHPLSASQTTSAYVSKLAEPSSQGRSIATTSWPPSCSSGDNRSQHQAPSQLPCTNA